jgi:hypothetical protein
MGARSGDSGTLVRRCFSLLAGLQAVERLFGTDGQCRGWCSVGPLHVACCVLTTAGAGLIEMQRPEETLPLSSDMRSHPAPHAARTHCARV